MVRDPAGAQDQPNLQEVLDALDDPDCRAIVKHLDEPMTASELSDTADIPLSTVYRKLELLSEASLLRELTEVRSDGHHTTRYDRDFDEVTLAITENREFDVTVARPARSAEEQLANMWSEVRKQT
ncbi:helix-turn-helix domain-containing protein (plasmid) [Halorussus salilacus]|uniref:winged helix-turn-helix domain-containing protein n=1 Tax=Halorussus salilacus TaxID=2953750 RepID=UPI00209DD215|nr:helix-turn-helix domain-containing protein [Halorussus salilacus]USZ69720.1 helix-turn-helix domain-containing protein [Halorussus salilacus]